MPRGGVSGNKGGSGKEGNIGNKGGSGKEGNIGNKGGSGSPGNKGGAPAAGNTNASSAETKARKLFHEGDVLQRHGNSTAALDKYEAALKFSPELCDAHNNIGVILSSRFEAGDRPAGRFSIIGEHFEKAVGTSTVAIDGFVSTTKATTAVYGEIAIVIRSQLIVASRVASRA